MSGPTQPQYEMALRALGNEITDTDVAVLDAFRSLPNAAATGPELAAALAYSSYHPANLAVGRLGAKIADAIPDYRPARRRNGSAMWWYVIADGEERSAEGHFVWTLRPELLRALGTVGI